MADIIKKYYKHIDTAKHLFYKYVVATYPLLEYLSQSEQYVWLPYAKSLYFIVLAFFSVIDANIPPATIQDKIEFVDKLQKGAMPNSKLLKKLGFDDRWINIKIYAVKKKDVYGLKDGQIYFDWDRVKYNIPKCPDGLTEEQKKEWYANFQKGFPTEKFEKNLYDAVVKAEEYVEREFKKHEKDVQKPKGRKRSKSKNKK